MMSRLHAVHQSSHQVFGGSDAAIPAYSEYWPDEEIVTSQLSDYNRKTIILNFNQYCL